MGQAKRVEFLEEIGRQRHSLAMLYVTGHRTNMGAQIANDQVELFAQHLSIIGTVPKISLILNTLGGDISASWSLAHLLHMFCDELEVIVPYRAMSAGTLLSLAAKRIVMTKQAALGPIDPTIGHPLGPMAGPQPQPIGVSVEELNGYLEFVRKSLGEKADISFALQQLAQTVHPLVLGQAYRARDQIRMLGTRLLEISGRANGESEDIKGIVGFLCGEARSHDFTINRREAERLKLPVEKCSAALYDVINSLWTDVKLEMQMDVPFNHLLVAPGSTLDYRFPRIIIESRKGGSDMLISAGQLSKTPVPNKPGSFNINDDRRQEGWVHAPAVA